MADEPIADVVARALAAANSAEMEPYTWLADAVTLAREVERLTVLVEYLRSVMYSAAEEIDDRSEWLGHVALSLRHAAATDVADAEIARRLRSLLAPTTEPEASG